MHRPDEVQENVSVRVHPYFLIGIRRAENAHLEQIAGADDGTLGFFRGAAAVSPALTGAEAGVEAGLAAERRAAPAWPRTMPCPATTR